MDPGSAPQRVGQAHVADQLANFEWHLRSAAATSRLPSPERTKTSTMPTNNSLRRHALSGGRSSIVFEIEIVADLAEADEKL